MQWRRVADQLRPKLPKPAALMDEAGRDGLAYMSVPPQHRATLHSTKPLERRNGEIKQSTEVVGIFPDEAAITRLVGASLLEPVCSNQSARTDRRMGHPARPLHHAGDHRPRQRGCTRKLARNGRLISPAEPASAMAHRLLLPPKDRAGQVVMMARMNCLGGLYPRAR